MPNRLLCVVAVYLSKPAGKIKKDLVVLNSFTYICIEINNQSSLGIRSSLLIQKWNAKYFSPIQKCSIDSSFKILLEKLLSAAFSF